jgi:hypothetical protein
VNYVERPDKSIFFRVVCANNLTQKKHIDQLFTELDQAISLVDHLGLKKSED